MSTERNQSTSEPEEPDEPGRRPATELDHLGRPQAFIEAEGEEARKQWDARLWKPIDGGIDDGQ